LNLNTNKITVQGGLTEQFAKEMNMQANILPYMDLVNRLVKLMQVPTQVVTNTHLPMYATGRNVSAAGNKPMHLLKLVTIILLQIL